MKNLVKMGQIPEGWKILKNKLHKKYTFENPTEAADFVSKVLDKANKLNHHPILKILFKEVNCFLSTHDLGDRITSKDIDLAKQIDSIKGKM